ncbi:MAG: hypothetical protein ACRCY8_14845 [Dermatophilaceae bacterium]
MPLAPAAVYTTGCGMTATNQVATTAGARHWGDQVESAGGGAAGAKRVPPEQVVGALAPQPTGPLGPADAPPNCLLTRPWW